MNRDLTFDPINAAAPDAYPITAATWLVVSRCQSDPRKADALKALLRFTYTTGRQSAEDTGFVPLTRTFREGGEGADPRDRDHAVLTRGEA